MKPTPQQHQVKADTKTCTKCGGTKLISEFRRRHKSADGYSSQCGTCVRATQKEWRDRNKDKIRIYNKRDYEKQKNRGLSNRYNPENYRRNSEIRKERSREYYRKNKERCLAVRSEYKIRNPQIQKEASLRVRLELRDSYVARIMYGRIGDFPKEVIEAKRTLLELKRLIKSIENNEQNQ